ncbi:cytochrome c oxidase assembly protein [Thermomicrobium sp. CFH 73360]|uniref:cytochrome c oxidase assembly protein n=1 Tax=Thermomicrobium sp. CFH 73360 TaxID=2951987 RepID=UPI002076B6FB|nr:cytochrome c oxidase assembly protein [Thermomicrobium sp. CFH 73360]MCM8745540.1 cytochrome c oxidase assembly protein [Thermomicrobium sp. CFH 73360]
MLIPVLHSCPTCPSVLGITLYPPALALVILPTLLYSLALWRLRQIGRSVPSSWPAAFYVGMFTALIALAGPLDTWNDELLTMHMAQHLVLIQITAPLLLLGRPVQVILRALPPHRAGTVTRLLLRPVWSRRILSILTAPLVATALASIALVVWHFPVLYEQAVLRQPIHDLQHLSFFGTALLFWWPIIDPVPRHHRMNGLWASLMVFITAVVSTVLGAIITLADDVIYSPYRYAAMPWGFTPMVDQQVAGLLMWIGGGTLYIVIILILLARWLLHEEGRRMASEPV